MILNNYNLLEYYYKNNLSIIDKIIISLLFYFAKIYFILFILGSLGLLNLEFVFILFILIEILNSIIYFKKRTLIIPNFNLNLTFVLQKPILLIVLTFLSSLYLYAIVKGSVYPPIDSDSLSYHLPAVVNWLKTGSLLSIQTPFGYYPLSGGLLSLWLIIPFHNDVLVNYQNIFPIVLCLFVIYEINKFYFNIEWNLLVIISLFSIFTIPYQLFTQLNDVLVLTFFSTVLYGLFKYKQNPRIVFLIVSGIALGILMGLKYNMIAYSIFIFVPLFIKGKSIRISERLKNVFIMLLLTIIFGGFWFIRNWILLESPIYPLIFSFNYYGLKNIIIDENVMGYSDFLSSMLITHIFKPELWYYILMNISKAGIIFLLLIPVIVFSLFKIQPKDKSIYWFLIFLTFYSFLIVFITPYSAENAKGILNMIKEQYQLVRFGLISFYLILLIGFYFLSTIQGYNKIILLKTVISISILIAILLSLPPFIEKYNGLLLFLFISLSLVIIILLNSIKLNKLNFKIIVIFTIILSIFILIEKKYKDIYRGELYNYCFNKPIEDYYNKSTKLLNWYYNNVHKKNVVLYGLKNYPFYGSEFENNILFGTEKDNLKNTDYVIVARDYPVPYSDKFGILPGIDEVIKRTPNFKLVYKDDLAYVYQKISKVK